MKQLIIAVFFLALCIADIGQTKTENDKYLKVQNQIDLINRQLIVKDSIIKELTKQTYNLKSNNEILSTSLDANDKIFNGLSTYFTLISILLSIIVIAIPVLNYFLVLKPNKETLAKLTKLETDIPKKIEEDFGVYLAGFEKRKAKQLIQSLYNPANLSQAVDFFFLSSFSDFDDEDQNRVIAFMENNKEIEKTNRLVLNSILRSKTSLVSESYYKRVLENEDKNNYEFALEYLVDNDPEKHLKFWELIITASPKGHTILLDIFRHLLDNFVGNPFNDIKPIEKKTFGEKMIKMFLNDEQICNAVENKELPKFKLEEMNVNVINWNLFIKETLYYKKFFDENGHRKKPPEI